MVKKIVAPSPTGRKRSLDVEIGDETLTSHGGLGPLISFTEDWLDLRARLDGQFHHLDGTWYSASELLSVLLASKIIGDSRMSDLARLDFDETVKYVLGLTTIPHPTTASRFLERMDECDLDSLRLLWAEILRTDLLTGRRSIVVDIDSTPVLLWGSQEGIAKGYSPMRKGGLTYHPNLAYEAKTGLPLHGLLRPGNRNSLGPEGEFEDFLDFLFAFVLRDIARVIFRADSGYFGDRVFRRLERFGAQYVISARGVIFGDLEPDAIEWQSPRKDIQYGEFRYAFGGWDEERRFVIKRDLRRESQTRIDGLRDTDMILATNKKGRPKSIVKFYDARGTAEQYIAEGKQGFAFGKFPSGKFLVNQIDFTLKLIAKGLMIAFRDKVLPESMRRRRPSTIRKLFVNVAAKLVRTGRRALLRFTRGLRHRETWEAMLARLSRPPPATCRG